MSHQRAKEAARLLITFAGVDLVQGITCGQHFHIRPEFLRKSFDNLVSQRVAANTQALCGHVSSNMILKAEAHHTVKLQVLPDKRRLF